jgi:hypothetical protein
MSNRGEYLAGTDPNNALSYLRIEILNSGLAGQKLSFMAISNKTYTLQYRTEWSTNGWGRLLDAESRTTNRVIEVFDYRPADPARFYQVVTPQQ